MLKFTHKFFDWFVGWTLGFCEIIDGLIRIATLGFWCPEIGVMWLENWIDIQNRRYIDK